MTPVQEPYATSSVELQRRRPADFEPRQTAPCFSRPGRVGGGGGLERSRVEFFLFFVVFRVWVFSAWVSSLGVLV